MHSGLPHPRRPRSQRHAYRAGCVGKEDLAAAHRVLQAAVDATESPQRKVATELEILRNRGHSKAVNFG
eukprot:scaffold9654_cov77-Skeletonema_dohrnii-CCMP3373.AAC.2